MSDLAVLDSPVEATDYLAVVRSLARHINSNRAIDNDFYKLWMSRKLSARQLEIFAANYFHRITPTVSRLARAFVSTEDLVSRAHLVRNISDELGHGDPKSAHINILRRWLDSLLLKQAGVDFDTVLERTPILAATKALTEGSLKLCSGPAPLANGAILAQEWHAYRQLVNLYEGFRNYMDDYDLEDFHNHSEYFYIHIGWAEKEHKDQSLETAVRSCHSEADLALLKQGFTEFLDLLAAFWNSLYLNLQLQG